MARRYSAAVIADILTNESDFDDEEIDHSDEDDDASYEEEENVDETESEEDIDTDERSSNGEYYYGRDGSCWFETSPHSSAYRQRNIVNVRPGLTAQTSHLEHQKDFFQRLLTPSMIQHIRDCTNKRLEDDIPEVTENEIWGFISILLILGVTKKRNVMIQEIWSPTSLHYQEFVTLIMSRNRFQQLCRFLTFDDVDGRRPTDSKFRKMKFLFSLFQEKIRTAFEPDSHVTIDETLYAFRGNCPFRQFMPSKPAKYGVKYFCMCDVKTACLCNVEIYLGKDQTEERQNDVGMNVVLRLVKTIEGTGRGVTTDNFFTSVPLCEKL